MNVLLAHLIIGGRPYVLKNNKRIYGRGRKKIVLPSKKYSAWETDACLSVRKQYQGDPINFEVGITYKFYFENRMAEADTSNLIEGVQDVLQKMGVIENDKLVMKVVAEKFFGHEDARTEVTIFKYNAP